jgi:hypothetical protein
MVMLVAMSVVESRAPAAPTASSRIRLERE